MEKKCSYCKKSKDTNEFYRDSYTKDGYYYICKECFDYKRDIKQGRSYLKEDRRLNKDKKRRCKNCNNIKKLNEFGKNKRVCKECMRNKALFYYYGNNQDTKSALDKRKEKENLLKLDKKKCTFCKKVKDLNKFTNHKRSKDSRNPYCKECMKNYKDLWKVENKEHYAIYNNNYIKNRKENDINYRIKCNLSTNLYHIIKYRKNFFPIKKILNYTIDELRKHLEIQFNENMDWNNYGSYWSIDHIIPQSLYNFVKEDGYLNFDEIQKCYSSKNLRPLEKMKNIRKSNSLDTELIKHRNLTKLLPGVSK